jgi:hypothetical protein
MKINSNQEKRLEGKMLVQESLPFIKDFVEKLDKGLEEIDEEAKLSML